MNITHEVFPNQQYEYQNMVWWFLFKYLLLDSFYSFHAIRLSLGLLPGCLTTFATTQSDAHTLGLGIDFYFDEPNLESWLDA